MAFEYGRWPKESNVFRYSWGDAPGYDEYRRWRKNNGHSVLKMTTTDSSFVNPTQLTIHLATDCN
jgi:hypothetical protein